MKKDGLNFLMTSSALHTVDYSINVCDYNQWRDSYWPLRAQLNTQEVRE